MTEKRSIDTLSLDGGSLIFDFINTTSSWVDNDRYDYISDYNKFISWSKKVALLSTQTLSKLMRRAEDQPEAAEKVMGKIARARDVAFHFFSAMIRGEVQPPGVLRDFNKLISQSLSSYSFDPTCNCICLITYDDLSSPLNLVFADAYEVLKYHPRERIKMCSSCGWIFLDTTKNGKRKWCNSLTCGSVDKSKRYYYRKKARKESQ